MVIQIVHTSDPDQDQSCEIAVFLDGQPVSDVEVQDIAPNDGWVRSQWDERLAEAETVAEEDPTPYRRAVAKALRDHAGSPYIRFT
jgi:hypothetical protein